MEKLYEAIVESDGRIRLNTPLHLEKGLRVLVAIPQADLDTSVSGIALSEPALAVDWNKPEEDDAWAHARNIGLSSSKLREAERLVESRKQEITDAWNNHFGG